ncbi:MAG: hypothetical protein IJP56_06545 [Synergistaceae bacterium]|nr:hypothetical protein [Synergistaceae bacterium]
MTADGAVICGVGVVGACAIGVLGFLTFYAMGSIKRVEESYLKWLERDFTDTEREEI